MQTVTKAIFTIISFFLFAQGRANWWFFGANAGLSFTTGSTVYVTTGQPFTSEGVSTISDTSGNLLFYTDGIDAYDKTYTQIPNGSGILGNSYTTQSAIIVPKPGSSSMFYICQIRQCFWLVVINAFKSQNYYQSQIKNAP